MAQNIFNIFRQGGPLVKSNVWKKYDEPTYISFRLNFNIDSRDIRNSTGVNGIYNYDWLPQPLLSSTDADNFSDRKYYSTFGYLIDNKDATRAWLLKEFIEKLGYLQENHQYYFQSISGLSNLLNIIPKRGSRIKYNDTITIKTLEGLDLRMSYLMNLYRKIAWDDTYQRWILPEMMRKFTLDIYLTEFRTYHNPKAVSNSNGNGTDLVLNIMNDILPVWKIRCNYCEFDIESLPYSFLNTDIGVDKENLATTEIKIKVGNIEEINKYPIFNKYIDEKNLNGLDRNDYTNLLMVNNRIILEESLPEQHTSTKPIGKDDQNVIIGPMGSTKQVQDKTWSTNAVSSVTNMGLTKVQQVVDTAKTTKIPGVGSSYTEIASSIGSKDIFSVLNLLKRSIDDLTNGDQGPSARLGNTIQNNTVISTLKNFLSELSVSTATSNPEISAAAMEILNNDGTWSQLKDYSLATDIVGPGEVNIPNKPLQTNIIETEAPQNKSIDNITIVGEQPTEQQIQSGIIFEGTPSSEATVKTKI